MGAACSRGSPPLDDAGPSSRAPGPAAERDFQSSVRWNAAPDPHGQKQNKGKLGRVVPDNSGPGTDGGAVGRSPRAAWGSGTTTHAPRSFTVDDLKAAGWEAFSAVTPAKKTPGSGSLPLAFLALETDGARRQKNTLVPCHINPATQRLFKINAVPKDFAVFMRKLLKRDPLLTFALQKALRNLKAGERMPVTHVTPDPNGQTSSLLGVRITPCLWKEDSGLASKALMLELNVSYDPAEVMPRLMRDYAVLSHVPAILTLIDFHGKILYQNASSLAYMGDLLSTKIEGGLESGLLQQLFAYDEYSMQQMLEVVQEGREWQGVVQVPYSLRRYRATHPASSADATALTHDSFTIQGAGTPARLTGPSNSGALQSSAADWDYEVEFQIGSSFSSKRPSKLASGGPKLLLSSKQQASLGTGMGSGSGRTGSPGLGVQRPHAGLSSQSDPELRQHHDAHAPHRLPPLSAGPNSASASNGGGGASPRHTVLGISEGMGDELAGGNSSIRNSNSMQQQGSPHNNPEGGPHQPRKFMSLLDKTNSVQVRHRVSENLNGVRSSDPNLGAQPALPGGSGSSEDGMGGDDRALEAVEEDNDKEASYDESHECFHEVHAIPLLDPVLDKQVIMLVQTDVTARVELENKLADLTDAQLSMLEQLFPRHVIEYMLARVPGRSSRNLRDLANRHDQVMVLFCDVVGFTAMSREVEPSQVMHFLNELYEVFDDLVDEYGMYKLDIVGDCYIVVAGLIKEDQDGFVCVDEMDEDQITNNAVRIMQFAKAMLRESMVVLMPHNSEPVVLRIGIHTGPLVSGLVGSKMPKFTLFGDTVCTASRMESTCRPGCVHVSDTFANLLPHEDWESTGGVMVKGKGLMETMLWVPNAQRQELLELDPDTTARQLRRVLTGNSFVSTRSRMTMRSVASMARSRRGSSGVSGDRLASQHPLMTILTNLHVRGTEESDSDYDHNSDRGSDRVVRPRSARRATHHRMMRPSMGYGGDRDRDGSGGDSDGGYPGTGAPTPARGPILSSGSRGRDREPARRTSEGQALQGAEQAGGGGGGGEPAGHSNRSLPHCRSMAKRQNDHHQQLLSTATVLTSALGGGQGMRPSNGAAGLGPGGRGGGPGGGGNGPSNSSRRQSEAGSHVRSECGMGPVGHCRPSAGRNPLKTGNVERNVPLTDNSGGGPVVFAEGSYPPERGTRGRVSEANAPPLPGVPSGPR